MKKSLVFMFLAAALALVCALGALGETTEPITVQREDGNLTVRIPVRAGDTGYWSCPLQDDSVVRIASVDADDAAYTVTFAPVADGAIDVEILHSNGVACDECHGFGLVVENGEIQEVESGYYTASSLEDDPLLDEALLGEWTDAEPAWRPWRSPRPTRATRWRSSPRTAPAAPMPGR